MENPEGRGVIRQIPSGGGGNGYFLKPHNKIKNPLITFSHFAAVPLILLLLNNIAVCYMCHFTITFRKNKKLLATIIYLLNHYELKYCKFILLSSTKYLKVITLNPKKYQQIGYTRHCSTYISYGTEEKIFLTTMTVFVYLFDFIFD